MFDTFTYYDEGWNAYIYGAKYNPEASRDWRDVWKDASDASVEDRKFI